MIVLGLTGAAGSGKDAAAAFLVEDGYTRIAFADPLRAMALSLNPIVSCNSAIHRLSDAVETYGWDVAKREYPEVRGILQRLGTDVIRNHVSDTFWVDRAFAGIKKNGTGKYVLTDVRFPQEFRSIVEANGIIVKISRPGLEALPGNHVSETALSGIDSDLIIDNDQDLEFLGTSIRALARWKRCRGCRVVKSPEEYMTNPRLAQGLHSYCRPCEASRMRDWRAKDPEGAARKERERHLIRTYGITVDRFDEMLDGQGGGCGICSTEPTPGGRAFAVDHNHETGATRGILCSVCNSSLERVEAIPGWCASAMAYLNHYENA